MNGNVLSTTSLKICTASSIHHFMLQPHCVIMITRRCFLSKINLFFYVWFVYDAPLTDLRSPQKRMQVRWTANRLIPRSWKIVSDRHLYTVVGVASRPRVSRAIILSLQDVIINHFCCTRFAFSASVLILLFNISWIHCSQSHARFRWDQSRLRLNFAEYRQLWSAGGSGTISHSSFNK